MGDKSEIQKLRSEVAQLRSAVRIANDTANFAKKAAQSAQLAADEGLRLIPAGGLDGQFLTRLANGGMGWRDVGKTGLPFADSN